MRGKTTLNYGDKEKYFELVRDYAGLISHGCRFSSRSMTYWPA